MKKFLLLGAVVLFSSSSLFGATFNAAQTIDQIPQSNVEEHESESDYMQPDTYSTIRTCGNREFYLDNWYYCDFTSTTEHTVYAQLENKDDDAGTYQGGQADVWLEYCDGYCAKRAHWDNVYLSPGRYMRVEYYMDETHGDVKYWHSVGNYDKMDNGYISLYSRVS